VPLKATTAPRPDLNAAVEQVQAFMEEVAACVPDDPPRGRDPLMDTLRRAQHFLAHHGLRSDADRVQLLRHVLLTAARGDMPDAERAYLRHVVAANEVLDASDADAAGEALAQFRASALWAEMQRADTVYTAVSFTLNEAVNGPHRVVHHQVDLVYYDTEGWHLVALDTGAPRPDGSSSPGRRRGAPSIAVANRWEVQAGHPVASRSVWRMEAWRRDRR